MRISGWSSDVCSSDLLYLSGALLRAKTSYCSAFASVQLRGDWGPWVELLIGSVAESCNESIAITQDLVALAERWERQLGRYRSHSATRRWPRFLLGHPVPSVQQAVEGLGVSQPAAKAGLHTLLAEGIVSMVNEPQRGRVFTGTE